MSHAPGKLEIRSRCSSDPNRGQVMSMTEKQAEGRTHIRLVPRKENPLFSKVEMDVMTESAHDGYSCKCTSSELHEQEMMMQNLARKLTKKKS